MPGSHGLLVSGRFDPNSCSSFGYAAQPPQLHNDDYTFGVDDETPVLDPRDDANFPFFKQAIEELCPVVTIERSEHTNWATSLIFITRPRQNWDAEDVVQEAEEPENHDSKETIGQAGSCNDGRCEVLTYDRTITFFPHTIEDYRRYAKALKIEIDERDERAAIKQKLEAIDKKKQAKMKAALG